MSRFSAVFRTSLVMVAACVWVICWHPARAIALDGPQLIGFSAESTALAGAGMVAVADTSAINTNPAALSLIQGSRFDLTPGILKPFTHHQDMFGNNTDGEDRPFAPGNLGFATRFASLPRLTVGAGIFTQGGFGTDLRNLTTAFGTVDQSSSFLRYLKASVALSYEVTDKLSIGVAPSLGYSDLSLRIFPGTSTPGFAGLDIRDICARNGGFGPLGSACPSDLVFSVKVGTMYKVLPWLTVGATYTSPVSFNYTGGQASLNFSAFGLGRVNYDVGVQGFRWPQQVDVAMAARPNDRLLIAFSTSWVNWASFNSLTVNATNPSNPLTPPQVSQSMAFNWKDQVVVAIGGAYALIQDASLKDRDRLVFRVGYHYSNNPVPDDTLTALAPVILEHKFTGGFGYRFTDHWSTDASVLYALKNSATSTNTSSPFGPNATESVSGYYVFLTGSYRY